jgi:hypothetical protein
VSHKMLNLLWKYRKRRVILIKDQGKYQPM